MRLRTLILLFALPARAAAQDSSVVLWTRETVHSAALKEDRPIYVAKPDGYRNDTTRRYPVLVILDADDTPQFNLALANVAFLASRAAIPPLIVVGIPNGNDRTHDLTPPATGNSAREFPTAGGAERFALFITDEVLPLVRQKYRTLSGTILGGHSFGGLLALEVAAKRPGTFAGIIAMSPALQWNDSAGVVTYPDAIVKSQKPLRLFVTSGGLEGVIDRPTQRFIHRLDSLKPPATVFGHNRYPENTHGLTPGPSLADGLRFVFDPVSTTHLPISTLDPSSDSAAIVNAWNESRRRYAIGAKIFGLDERFPEASTNQLGYTALEVKKPALGVWLFRQNVEMYPGSANTYDSLGDGLLAMGDTTAAIAAFKRAVDVATRTHDPVLPFSAQKLKALELVAAGKPKHK